MSARLVAARVLLRVWKDGSYAAAALSAELESQGLKAQDRALSTELTYGVLRTQKYLEARLSEFGKVKTSDYGMLAHLLIAAYQIEFLDRIPEKAAVNEAVGSVRELRGEQVAGFCNAILRRLSERSPEKTLADATFDSQPSWLRKRLIRDVGEVEARALLSARDHVPTLRCSRKDWPSDFREWLDENAEPCSELPRAYRYRGGGDPRKSPWHEAGLFVVQELGAQMVGHALAAKEGQSVLDACAGRGQKASLLAEQVGPKGRVLATDLHDHKLAALDREMARLELTVERRPWDWTNPAPREWTGAFDRVLVDAPCTGVGTLRRHPEIARRLSPEDPARMGELQARIGENAAGCLKPGGLMVFATCSVFREEGDKVVGLLEAAGLRSVHSKKVLAGLVREPEGSLRLSPIRSNTDGYFIAWLAK